MRRWSNKLVEVTAEEVEARVAPLRELKAREEAARFAREPEGDDDSDRDANPSMSAAEAVRFILAAESATLAKRRARWHTAA